MLNLGGLRYRVLDGLDVGNFVRNEELEIEARVGMFIVDFCSLPGFAIKHGGSMRVQEAAVATG